MVILGGVIVATTQNAAAYVSKAEYVITEYDYAYQSNDIQNPIPNIISINPSYGYLNSGEKIVTIVGSNFTPNSIARYDGSNRPTAYIDSTRLQMKLTPNDMTQLGTHRVSVFNPAPSGGYSNAVAYNVINGNSGQVQGATTVRKAVTTKRKTASIVLAKDTEYKISCEDENNIYTGSTINNNGYDNEYYGNQSANALSSSKDSSFLPNTLIEWILLAGLIALIVVVWRKVTRTNEEKHAPLKHA